MIQRKNMLLYTGKKIYDKIKMMKMREENVTFRFFFVRKKKKIIQLKKIAAIATCDSNYLNFLEELLISL